jgi:hypothetical protein
MDLFAPLKKLASLFYQNSRYQTVPANEIPRQAMNMLVKHPLARKILYLTSLELDIEGSHYHGMLNTLANHIVGPCPIMVGQTDIPEVNSNIEDKWIEFCNDNSIGTEIRLARRAAARSGICIIIPYKKRSGNDVKLGLRVVPSEKLANPPGGSIEDRIFEGIEYDENWEPIKIYLDTGESYNVDDIIIWWKKKDELRLAGIPECSSAFCVLPSVRRYLDSIIRSAEFRAAIPLAVTLDPTIWGKESVTANNINLPKGKFPFEPGMIPTLPPGTKLEGIPYSITSQESSENLRLMIGSSARAINMPVNLATGDSSLYNMASSQVDLGPWKENLILERTDFMPVISKIVKLWIEGGSLVDNYFLPATRRLFNKKQLSYSMSFKSPFKHPDPQKVSNSLFTDLISGATTFTQYHTEEGRNPRRMIEREAQTLGKTYEELVDIYLVNRSPSVLQLIRNIEVQDPQESSSDNKKE